MLRNTRFIVLTANKMPDWRPSIFGILLCLLFAFFSSTGGLPHPTFSTDITEMSNPDLDSDPANLPPDFNLIMDHKHQNVLSKHSLHPSAKGKLRKARYFMDISVNTELSIFRTSPKFLSISVPPRKVAGSMCIPWDSKKLKVCCWVLLENLPIRPLFVFLFFFTLY